MIQHVPFLKQEFSNEDEEDYDEKLDKAFNKTVGYITIDDISRYLETLEIIPSDEEEDKRYNEIGTGQKQYHSSFPPSSSSSSIHQY